MDLAELDPAWRGRAHFLYFDSPYYLEFALRDGKYKLRRAFDLTTRDGRRIVEWASRPMHPRTRRPPTPTA